MLAGVSCHAPRVEHATVDVATIYAALAVSAANRPDAIALEDGDSTLTYAELLALADADAGRLRSLRVEQGDRVVIWLPNGARWASLFFACARLGAVAVPAGTRLRLLDLRHILEDCRARVLIYAPSFLNIDYESIVDELEREQTVGGDSPLVFVAAGAGVRPGRTMLDALDAAPLESACGEELAPAIACYTSGTTGRPKGCVHAHCALVRNGRIAAAMIGLGPTDRILCPVPFAHVFGFHMGILQSTLSGATLINAEPYSPDRLLDLAQSTSATVLYLVPTMAREALREQRRRPRELAQVRMTLVAGAPVSPDLRSSLRDPTNGWSCELSVVYGCTEAPTLTQLLPTDPAAPSLSSVGRPTPGVSVRVCRPGSLEPLHDGEVGEILARGYNQMLGYLGNAEATAAKLRGGWLVTGDLGWLDGDGFLHFSGRDSEMFLVGGFNVYPREVEGQLEQCEGVGEVAVIGVPDERLGAVPMAWVTPVSVTLTEDGMLAWCRSNLASHKRPRYVRVVRSLPRTATGKVSRVKLEQLARRALPQLSWELAQR